DGDIVVLTYVWSRNGTVVQTTADTSAVTDTLDLTKLSDVAVGDSFSVQVTPYDGTLHGAPTAATTSVGASTPGPQPGTASLGHGVSTGVDITLVATDEEGSPLTFSLVGPSGGAAHGSVTLDGNVAHHTPTGGFVGVDTFAFTASNGAFTSSPATVGVTL